MQKRIAKVLAIVPDGNGAWAKKRGLPRSEGHAEGHVVTRRIIRAAFDANVLHVAFWALSEANMQNRPEGEIAFLYELFKQELRRRRSTGDESTHVQVRGRWNEYRVDPELNELIAEAHERTQRYAGGRTLTVLMGYSGQNDILLAANRPPPCGTHTAGSFAQGLITADVPPVDILIRTGGKHHLSQGFLAWQMTGDVYVEFSKRNWPDFSIRDLHAALFRYQRYEFKGGA